MSGKTELMVRKYCRAALAFLRRFKGRKNVWANSGGYVYAPYVPLQVTPTIIGPANFSQRKGIMTRYSKSPINMNFYGTITVKDTEKK